MSIIGDDSLWDVSILGIMALITGACGKLGHSGKECHFGPGGRREHTCSKCGKIGHLEGVCRSSPKEDTDKDKKTIYIDNIILLSDHLMVLSHHRIIGLAVFL